MLYSFGIFEFRDILEIFFFSLIIYSFSCWLIADKTKPLLIYFYSYLTIITCSHYCGFQTVPLFLLLTAPGIIALFTLIHQHTLQKNFVSLKNVTMPLHTATDDWASILGQLILQQLNQKKDMTCIIEFSDNLEPFLISPFILGAPLSETLTQFLFQSPSYNPYRMLWIRSNGIVQGINTQWYDLAHTGITQLYDITIMNTLHNNALFFHANPNSHTCTIIKKGIIEKDKTVHQLQAIIRQHTAIHSINNKGEVHAHRIHTQTKQKNAP